MLISFQVQEPCILLPCSSSKCKPEKFFRSNRNHQLKYMWVCIYIIPILIYLSIFLSIFEVSIKEIKLLLSDSSFMLNWCSWPPKYTNTGNLQCDLIMFIRHYSYAPNIFHITFLDNSHFQLSDLS